MQSTTLGLATLLVAAVAWSWSSRRRRRLLQRQSTLALHEAVVLRQTLRNKLGIDIGGTLAKIVLAKIVLAGDKHAPPEDVSLAHSTYHASLNFDARGGGFSFAFISTPTETLEQTSRLIAKTLQYPKDGQFRDIVATGGGAHRFRAMFRDVLQVELQPIKELQAVIEGLLFLASEGPTTELFTVEEGVESTVEWPEQLFPFLLVNMGSGVSVVRVDGAQSFTRVGGTACGGATFLGLGRALTGIQDFHALLALAARGDESRVDKTVGDIYGSGGCVDLGMAPAHTAASFGKLALAQQAAPAQIEDVVRSLLRMVVQASVVLARAYAAHADCLDRIVFAGGFLQDNELARREIAQGMGLVGGRALFCRHSEFLGALGSLGACIVRHRDAQRDDASAAAEPSSPNPWQPGALRASGSERAGGTGGSSGSPESRRSWPLGVVGGGGSGGGGDQNSNRW